MTKVAPFDDQAQHFERRAGIPQSIAEEVGKALIECTKLQGGRLLEIGAGTGEIGAQFLERGVDYFAIDQSSSMLEIFAQRVAPEHRNRLRIGDADDPWPVDDGSLQAIFLSRVAHLLDRRKLWSEARRTAGPFGCWLVIGRRARERESVRACLRQRLHELLAEIGIGHRRGSGTNWMLDRPNKKYDTDDADRSKPDKPDEGAQFRYESEHWPVVQRPIDALEAWRGKSGLAGVELDVRLKSGVLDRLSEWARDRYGDLQAEHPSEEWYELHGTHVLPARS